MAITRAQQVKQMLREGGRIGFKGGADAATESFGKSVGYSGPDGSTGRPDKDFNPGTGGGGPTFSDAKASQLSKDQIKREKEYRNFIQAFNKKPPFVGPTASFLRNLIPGNTKLRGQFINQKLQNERIKDFYENLSNDEKNNFEVMQALNAVGYDQYAADMGSPGLLYSGNVGNLEKFVTGEDAFGNTTYGYKEKTGDGDGMSDYERRLLELEQATRAPSSMDQEPGEEGGLRLAFRANGGRIGFFKGAQADASAGKGAMSPGTDTSGGFRGGGGNNNQQTVTAPNKGSNQQTITAPSNPKLTSKARRVFDLFNIFTPAAAAELSEDELNIQRALNKKSYDDTIKETLSGKIEAGGGITDVIPDLNNPDMLNKIAIDAGLPTQKEGVIGFREDVATPKSTNIIKSIQNFKRSEDPDLKLTAPEIVDFFGTDGQYKGLNVDEVQNIYDMVSLPGQNRFMAAEGGMMSPEGGIMDLESGRQMYFLGKLVKKATRAVKKIVKSPIGKAALFASPLLMSSAARSGLASFLFKNPMAKGSGFGGFMEMLRGGMTGGGKFALGAGLTLAPFLFGNEEEKQQPMYQGADIADPNFIMANYSKFTNPRLAAEGGLMRAAYQEGSKEPVAKKTMPLLDMDGKEMDLREEGGFVPIGRMEKADDVPARLSKNEFVFTADAVRNAGDGNVDKGAEVMYNMMKNLESGGDVSEESQGLEGAREMFQTSQRLEEVL